MMFPRTTNLFNICMHVVIVKLCYFLLVPSLHACGVLIILVKEKKSGLAKQSLSFTLVPVICVCDLV